MPRPSSNTIVSKKTLKKISKAKKSRSKSRRNRKHISKLLDSNLPQQYYYSQSTSYTKKVEDGKVEEHGLEVIDNSKSNKLVIRKLDNGKIVESMVPK